MTRKRRPTVRIDDLSAGEVIVWHEYCPWCGRYMDAHIAVRAVKGVGYVCVDCYYATSDADSVSGFGVSKGEQHDG